MYGFLVIPLVSCHASGLVFQSCQIWTESGSDWPPMGMGHIWNFSDQINFSTFWLIELI